MINLSRRGRAGHLSHDADVRHDPRERRARSDDAQGEVRGPVDHREHARVVSAALHPRTTCRAAAAGTRRTSSSSPPMRSACCRPIARLTREQAMYYFLSGYTAKVAGTERGVTEPQATFSACFGAVFLVWHPTKYAEMLGRLIDEHGSHVWLVNTGWSGGAVRRGQAHEARRTRARWCARRSTAQLDDVATRDGPGVRPRRADRGARRAGRGARPARHVERPGRVRRAGEEARRRCSAKNFEKFGSRRGAIAIAGARAPQGLVRQTGDDADTCSSHVLSEIIRDPLWNNIRVDPLALAAGRHAGVPAAALRPAARARVPRLSRRDATRASSTRSAPTTSRAARSALLEERGELTGSSGRRMSRRAHAPRCCTTSGTTRSRTRSRRSARCTTRRSRGRSSRAARSADVLRARARRRRARARASRSSAARATARCRD